MVSALPNRGASNLYQYARDCGSVSEVQGCLAKIILDYNTILCCIEIGRI